MIRLIEFQKISGLVTNEEFNQMNASFFLFYFFYSAQIINYCNEIHVVAL